MLGQAGFLAAQKPGKVPKETGEKATSESVKPKESSSVTHHTIRLDGRNIPYEATAGTILLKNEKGDPTASIFYVAYTRSDVQNLSERPLAFLYNGGPGSSSAWLHMGAFGPRRVITANAEPTPPAPYKVVDNAHCLLDKADLVFIDPVGTGFSHAVGKAKDKDFWGIDQDVHSIAQFIDTYVSRNDRWNSPKFLIGESYGTFRSAALADYLQSHDGMDVNGIVLISTVLDMETLSFRLGDDMPYVFYLPSYAATACYHKVLKDRPADLNAFLMEARHFASTEYAHALMKGSNLSAQERADVLKKLSYFTGLSQDYLAKAKLRVSLRQFMEELQRSRGLTTGRLDARFSGPTYDLLGEFAAYDPQETAITGAFTAAFNNYVRQALKFGKGKTYLLMNGRVKWDWKRKHPPTGSSGFPGSPSVMGDLAQALIANPHLQVQVENGFFDLATPFFATEYTMDHLGLPPNLEDHIHMEYYQAGHMMYLRDASLARLKTNIDAFIDNASRQ